MRLILAVATTMLALTGPAMAQSTLILPEPGGAISDPYCSGNVPCKTPAEHSATTMFVRFRQGPYRLQVSITETRRVAGKVRHEHIASLGSIELPLTVAGRIAFWVRVNARLADLSNRIDPAMQGKIRGDLHARVPMVTPDEQRGLQLTNAEADQRFWEICRDMNQEQVDGHAALAGTAERAMAVARAEASKAAANVTIAKERV